MLLVVAAYTNLFLTFYKKRKRSNRTKLPISSKQWEESKLEQKIYDDENLKTWIKNSKALDR